MTTAVEVLRHHDGVRLRVEPGLRELDFGTFERRPERDLEAVEPWTSFVPRMLDGSHPGLPRGESGATFMQRVTDVFARIIAAHDDGEVLVVGHGLTLGAWLWTLQPGPLVPLPNASVSTVQVADGVATVIEAGLDIAGHGHTAARPAPSPVPAGAPTV